MFTDSAKWSAICASFDEIKSDAFAQGLGKAWQRLVDGTRAGATTVVEWGRFLDEVDRVAADEQNFVSKGDPFRRRLAALRAAAGDYTCAGGLCERSAVQERAGLPPTCALLDRPMTLS